MKFFKCNWKAENDIPMRGPSSSIRAETISTFCPS